MAFFYPALLRTVFSIWAGQPRAETGSLRFTEEQTACLICLSGCRCRGENRRKEKKKTGRGWLAGWLACERNLFATLVCFGRTVRNRIGRLFFAFSFVSFFGCPFASHITAGRSMTRPAWSGCCLGSRYHTRDTRPICVFTLPPSLACWVGVICVFVRMCSWDMSRIVHSISGIIMS